MGTAQFCWGNRASKNPRGCSKEELGLISHSSGAGSERSHYQNLTEDAKVIYFTKIPLVLSL